MLTLHSILALQPPASPVVPDDSAAGVADGDLFASPMHVPETSGAAAVTASIAAAVRESLLVSVPADTMLSSALFEDFTREVAARIIQHYWRERMSRQAAARHQHSSKAGHLQDQGPVAESQHQGHDTSHNPGNAEAVPELIQDDSLPELLMRYRADIGKVHEQQQAPAQAAEHSLGARASRGQNAPMALHTAKMDVAKTGDMKRDGLLPIAADDTAASSSSLDRLKARHSKHRRPAQLTANTAASAAQRAVAQQASGARQSNTGLVRLAPATGAATDDLSLHQARFAMPEQRDQSTAGSTASEDKAELSTTCPACEDSDNALFELLNQSPQGCAYMSASAAAAQLVSHSGRQQQQQQQTLSIDNVRGSHSEFQEVSDENASPNVSPCQGQAKQHKQQQHQQKAAWDRASDPASKTERSQPDGPFASATAAALYVTADDPTSASALQPAADSQVVAKGHDNLIRSERLSTDKLADIFAFLDDVEAQAEEEAARVLSQASTPSHSRPIRVLGHAQQPCCQGHMLQPSQAFPVDSCSRASSLAQPRQQQTHLLQGQFQDLRAHIGRHCPSSGGLPAGKPILDSKLDAGTSASRASPSRAVEQMPATRADVADAGSARDTADTASTGAFARHRMSGWKPGKRRLCCGICWMTARINLSPC